MGRRAARRLAVAAVACVLASCGDGGGVRMTLAPGASRACTGQVQITPTYLKDTSQLPPPQVLAMTETFSATRSAEGYLFTLGGGAEMGAMSMTANVAVDGTVISAQITGTERFSSATPDALNALAISTARNIPERQILGRDFKIGDDLYRPGDAQVLADAMFPAMGMPAGFELHVEGRLALTGVSEESGRRVVRFAGNIRMLASGPGTGMGGHRMAMQFPAQMSMRYDAATGLLRDSAASGEMTMNFDGQRYAVARMVQTTSCTITGG